MSASAALRQMMAFGLSQEQSLLVLEKFEQDVSRKRRTEFLLPLLANFDVPIRTALASAYAQGMNDTLDLAGVFNEETK